jgi:hypothetical protein
MYWYGTPHPTTGVNLATCIWESRAHARAANGRPHHVKAMRLAAAAYEMYALEVRAMRYWEDTQMLMMPQRYTLRKVAGEEGVRIEDYSEASWEGQ